MSNTADVEAARKLRKLSKDLKTLMSLIVKEEVTKIQKEIQTLEKEHGQTPKK